MAKKQKPKKNGGRRPNAGRKSVETHFASIEKRFDRLERLMESLAGLIMEGNGAAALAEDLATTALRRFSAGVDASVAGANGTQMPLPYNNDDDGLSPAQLDAIRTPLPAEPPSDV
jgi:hypothetical protein